MIEPAIPENEEIRLKSLYSTHLLNTPIEQGFERITMLAKKIFDVPIAAIGLIDDKREWFKSIIGLNDRETPRSTSFCGHAILSEDVMVVGDAQMDPRFADNPFVMGAPAVRFYAGCPIHAGGSQRIGSICIIDTIPRQISSHEKAILKSIASIVDIEIRNHQLIHDTEQALKEMGALKRASLLDPLTKLWNKQGIACVLEDKINKSVIDNASFALIELSLDGLKSMCDEFGKDAGKDMLQGIARSLVNSCRGEDAIGYIGGKEFTIIASIKEPGDALAVAERISSTLQDEPLLTRAGPIKMTATAGVVVFDPARHTSTQVMLKEANKLLTEGRRNGGNKIRMA